jgi:cardiolipin synthase
MSIVTVSCDCHQPPQTREIAIFILNYSKLCMSSGKSTSGYTLHNKIQLIRGGASYFRFLENLIAQAQHSIFIRIYIWVNDETGSAIAAQLIRAAERNVSVFIMADGYASQSLPREFIRKLREKGIHFRFFEPLLRSSHFYFGRRMHEKMVVVDGAHALVGGINFAIRYNDTNGIPAWLDFALYSGGESARQLYHYCTDDWPNSTIPDPPPYPIDLMESKCSVRIRRNDWVKGKHEVWKTYFNWFNQANRSITIMCSYFLPGQVLRHRLSLAARRGVKIKLILAGQSDIPLAKYAEQYLYAWMLRNGIEIYEYQPSVLHAKLMVVDDHWVTIGSFNVNNVSAYASKELNLDVRNKPFAGSVARLMDKIIEEDCVPVTEKNFISNATFFKRFLQKSAYEFIRVVLNLSTFYFKHE